MTPLEQCKTTKLSWGAMKSCAPITKTDIQCADSKGAYWPVTPAVTGPKLYVDIPNSFFAETPFNLVAGDKLLCKIRAHNSNGSGSWSMTNEPFSLNGDCATTEAPKPAVGCGVCSKPCKTSGCASCCGKKKNVLLENHVHEQHRHEYCHVHPEDQSRCIKKTVWKEQPYMEKVIRVRPMNVTRKVTVLRKESKMVPMTAFVNKTVQER